MMTVYFLETADLTAEQMESMEAALPPERRRRAGRITNPFVKRESIAAAYLTLYGLAAGDTDGGLRFPNGETLLERTDSVSGFAASAGWPVDSHGKPFAGGVKTGSGTLYVNLSHSEGLVAAAVARVPVGADVQRIPAAEPDKLMRIAGKFHPMEREYLAALPSDRLPAAFCRLWAGKESVMKLCGRGLALPLSSFYIHDGSSELDGRQIRLYIETLKDAVFSAAFWA